MKGLPPVPSLASRISYFTFRPYWGSFRVQKNIVVKESSKSCTNHTGTLFVGLCLALPNTSKLLPVFAYRTQPVLHKSCALVPSLHSSSCSAAVPLWSSRYTLGCDENSITAATGAVVTVRGLSTCLGISMAHANPSNASMCHDV